MNPINDTFNTTQNVATTSFNGDIVIAYQGLANPGALFTAISANGKSWPDSEPIDQTADCISGPFLIVFENTIYLFYCVPSGGGESTIAYTTSKDAVTWSDPVRLPAEFNSSLVLTGVVNENQLFIYYKGYGTDAKVYGAYMGTDGSWNSVNP